METEFPEGHSTLTNPNGSFRLYWDFTTMLLMIYVVVVTPFDIAFVESATSWDEIDSLWWANRTVRLKVWARERGHTSQQSKRGSE